MPYLAELQCIIAHLCNELLSSERDEVSDARVRTTETRAQEVVRNELLRELEGVRAAVITIGVAL